MKHWIVDKNENYITVHEEGNPENYALREKAKLTYNGFGTITGFQFEDSVVEQAYKVYEMLNELEGYRVNSEEVDNAET